MLGLLLITTHDAECFTLGFLASLVVAIFACEFAEESSNDLWL